MAGQDAEFTTTIGQDATFNGKLSFEKSARILGNFEGEVGTKGELVIADSGKFSGEANAGSIRVEGNVRGNLNASGKIQLSSTARIDGDIVAAKLEVSDGAILTGRLSVGVKPEDRTHTTPVKTATVPVDRVKTLRSEHTETPAPATVGR